MDEDNKITMIRLTKHNRGRLKDLGKKGETFNDIINRLIEFYEKS